MTQEMNARLIEQYQEAVRARARLRRTLFAATLTSFIVFGLLLWKSGHVFASQGIASVNRELAEHLNANGDHYASSLTEVAGGVFDAYKAAAIKQVHSDIPKLETVAHEELEQLNSFTQKRWKDFEAELAVMSSEQEQIVREELAKITSEERARQIAESYGAEMDDRLKGFLRTAFGEHLRVGEEIAYNLNRITELEPDINHPFGVNHAIGLTLELSGLAFQDLNDQ